MNKNIALVILKVNHYTSRLVSLQFTTIFDVCFKLVSLFDAALSLHRLAVSDIFYATLKASHRPRHHLYQLACVSLCYNFLILKYTSIPLKNVSRQFTHWLSLVSCLGCNHDTYGEFVLFWIGTYSTLWDCCVSIIVGMKTQGRG